MTKPILVLTPAVAAVSERGGSLDVLVRVQAPEQPKELASKLTPKRLALVVDRSGSMSGEPLDEALACVNYIASRMTPADQISVVVYDDQVNTLVPLTPVLSSAEIAAAIANVRSGGSTALFDGWERGAQELEGRTPDTISRVILLSDGQANVGLRNVSEISRHCANWLEKGVSTSTVGLGRGFNEDLMMAMARAGGGQQYYGQTAADLHDSFDEEFSLLAALFLRNLGVRLVAADGVIAEPIGLVQPGPSGFYRLTDLAWGAEVWMGLRLHTNANPARAAGQTRDLLAVTLQAEDLQGRPIPSQMQILSLPVVDPAAFAAMAADELVERRVAELEFAHESQALRDLARQGRTQDVEDLLARLDARYGRHPWLRDKLARLRRLAREDMEMMGKESHYSAMKMSARQSNVHEMAYISDETNMEMPAFLRKKAEEGRGRSK
jgi:Ca-activated chloride channel family protein